MIKTLVESPFAGHGDTLEERKAEEAENIRYARACLHDCFTRNEAPYASHLLYTQEGVLDDDIPEERTLGIDAGLVWGAEADKTAVYLDRGFSTGMKYGVKNALKAERPIEFRALGNYTEQFGESSNVMGAIKFHLPNWQKDLDKAVKDTYRALLEAGKVTGDLADFLEELFQ